MQRCFHFFFSACLALLFLLHAPHASAQSAAPRATYVVEVLGDRVDAARVRAAVGRELSVTAVAPDDPLAASATGTIKVEASAATKTLTVTFRKVETPVMRTVRLPDDPGRAEVAAVFLAGNLARDEATELLGGMKRPNVSEEPGAPPPAPARPSQTAAQARDDEDLRRLRITLQEEVEAQRRRRRAGGIGALSFAALTVPAGIVLIAGHRSQGSVSAGNVLLGLGGAGVGLGVALLAIRSASPEEELQKKAAEIEAEGGSSTVVLAQIDAAWEEQASKAKSSRTGGGILSIVIGTIAVGLGGTLELTLPRDKAHDPFATFLYGLGAADIGVGIFALIAESPFETSYRTWKKLRAPPITTAARVRPSVGFAPAPGGGTLSVGFAF